jgi:hypothetical protein
MKTEAIEIEDLFNTPEKLPTEVQIILENFAEREQTYENCQQLEQALRPHGYTFSWGLDAEPYDLRKTN